MKKFGILILALTAFLQLSAVSSLDEGFASPPSEARARTWWHWLNGNVTREGITADLEAMREAGIRDAQIFCVRRRLRIHTRSQPVPLMSDNTYLSQLNEAQRAAVEYLGGPELVIAGAGSGKTRVLTYKILHLLANGHSPGRIIALTFTNKAAREMRDRIEKLAGPEMASRLWMGTFHSIFSRMLRRNADLIGFRSDFTGYDASA